MVNSSARGGLPESKFLCFEATFETFDDLPFYLFMNSAQTTESLLSDSEGDFTQAILRVAKSSHHVPFSAGYNLKKSAATTVGNE